MIEATRIAEVSEDPVRAWVRALMRARNTDPTGLARLAEINQSILSRFMNGRTAELGPSTLRALAKIGSVPAPEIVRIVVDRSRPDAAPAPRTVRRLAPAAIPNTESEGVPVWGVHPRERDGEFHLNPIPIQLLQRPAAMAGSRRMACFYAPDETMAPRWLMGEPVVVDLMRPATQGVVALVKLANEREPNGEETYLLRRYDGRRGDRVLLSQLVDPPGTLSLPLTRIVEMRRVLDWNDFLTKP